jgi:hypothetical protein
LVDDHEEPHAAGLCGRGDVPEGCDLVGVRGGLARVPDAGDRQRVEAGARQLTDEGGRVAGAGCVVDDADGELVPGTAAAGDEQGEYEERAGTNGAVFTAGLRFKPATSKSPRWRCRSASRR